MSNSLEITGKLLQKLPEQNGEGRNGTWRKQEFVIETEDQYPKKVCMNLWGDKISMLDQFGEGDRVKASINIESREYNGRWYTDIKAWRLESPGASGSNPSTGGSSKPNLGDDPFPDDLSDMGGGGDSDMPF